MLIKIMTIIFIIFLIDELFIFLPTKKWYRELRGGKWWKCYHYNRGNFWVKSINKPEGLTVTNYEDYDKIIK